MPDPYMVPFRTMDELHSYAYGMGDLIAKTNYPVYSGTTAAWNAIYGKRVWSQLNYEANTFAMLPKQPWANSGWRTEVGFPPSTAPWTRGTAPTGGVAEVDATPEISLVPDTIRPSWDQLVAKPKQVWHGFDTSEIMDFLSGVDDSVDAMPVMRESMGKFHALQLDAMLLADAAGAAGGVIINLETLDRIISSYSEWNGDPNLTLEDSNPWDDSAGNQVDRSVTADAFYDSYVSHNSDVARTLTLPIIDECLENIWLNGGKPKVIITGYDTLMAWQQLLQSQRRYMESAQVVATFGGIRSVAPGFEGGFMVSTYHGIPIIPSQNVIDETGEKSRIYFLDTDYMWIRVARPTQYFESRDMLLLGKIGFEGAYRTIGEVMCKNFKAQGKIRDIK